MYIIAVGAGLALGVVFTTHEKAEAAANRLGLTNYTIEFEEGSHNV